MRVLVTGAGGMIGRATMAELRRRGLDAVGVTRNTPRSEADGFEYVGADLSIADRAAALVEAIAPTHILHAAWETRPPTYWNDPVNIDWVLSTGAMARAFANCGGVCFVQVGSCAEYAWSDGLCREDETPDKPKTRYGQGKLAAYHAVSTAGMDRFTCIDARIFSVYGPYEHPDRLIPYICRAHLSGEVPKLSSGVQVRDLMHADDAASALVSLLLQTRVSGVVNVACGAPIRLARVASCLAEIANASVIGLGLRDDRPGEPEVLVAANDRLCSVGWRPQHTLETGLAAAFEWWKGIAGETRR